MTPSVIGESKTIKDCVDNEIKAVLKYIIILIGLPINKVPQDEAKQALINFIRGWMKNEKLEELRLAFDLAVAKKTDINLTLYGHDFSAKYIIDVFDAYRHYKKKNEPKEEGMNNVDRLNSIIGLVSQIPGALDTLKQIGDTKKTYEVFRTPYWDSHQKWMKQWDFHIRYLRCDEVNPNKFIIRYKKILSQDDFFNHKIEQLKRVKEYLDKRNSDIL